MPDPSAATTEWAWCTTHNRSVPPRGEDCGGGAAGTCEVILNRSIREYDAKIWNLPETPGMFHRQAPGLPMTTRCGLAMGREARSTTHSFAQFNACPVCFEGWTE